MKSTITKDGMLMTLRRYSKLANAISNFIDYHVPSEAFPDNFDCEFDEDGQRESIFIHILNDDGTIQSTTEYTFDDFIKWHNENFEKHEMARKKSEQMKKEYFKKESKAGHYNSSLSYAIQAVMEYKPGLSVGGLINSSKLSRKERSFVFDTIGIKGEEPLKYGFEDNISFDAMEKNGCSNEMMMSIRRKIEKFAVSLVPDV